ncbi:helix-turn-helix domain-containing protein [Paractinoplanes lichenicola]|uniref:Helix-turn-helix domain-containing protein n=1 Tax=Paractinoplanes lichenicola TaxID=2802976 RepID=A0ABS1VWF2_9ACTN|nr:helix-turn-helix transcriptional regulator [Actinoplanes lichenicola]MBL7258829.1 helix-turn-helix domain-containing protein [Actinoplanes lichenicola]
MPANRVALAEFLRSRRDRLKPAQAGVQPFPGARRVPGLRREELAMLAGLSVDYYTRIEQGRQANISAEVLAALSRALQLDDIECAHLRDLAAPAGRRGSDASTRQRADPGLLRVMTALDHLPVLLLGRRSAVLARTALLGAVLGREFEIGDSFVRYLFRDPLAQMRIVNWEVFAQAAVAGMRREAGCHPHDSLLHAEIAALRRSDPKVDRWWQDQKVGDYTSAAKQIAHPDLGHLHFDIEHIIAPHDPDQHLIVYTTPPDSPTALLLPMLANRELADSTLPT